MNDHQTLVNSFLSIPLFAKQITQQDFNCCCGNFMREINKVTAGNLLGNYSIYGSMSSHYSCATL